MSSSGQSNGIENCKPEEQFAQMDEVCEIHHFVRKRCNLAEIYYFYIKLGDLGKTSESLQT